MMMIIIMMIYIYICREREIERERDRERERKIGRPGPGGEHARDPRREVAGHLGGKRSQTRNQTSEIIADFQWHFPMDAQWHFPMEFHFCDFWCVIVCPDHRDGVGGGVPALAVVRDRLDRAEGDGLRVLGVALLTCQKLLV